MYGFSPVDGAQYHFWTPWYLLDWATMVALGVVLILVYTLAKPVQRQVVPGDASLGYTVGPSETVPTWLLFVLSVVAPVCCVCCVLAWLRWGPRKLPLRLIGHGMRGRESCPRY